jgi:hypothetical protein
MLARASAGADQSAICAAPRGMAGSVAFRPLRPRGT